MESTTTYSSPLLASRVEMFKRGLFDFITTKGGKKHKKQEKALQILTDKVTTELLYGGAAGGAKSWTGAAWLTFSALAYPGTKWFIGREELKRLRDSTYITFLKVCKAYGLKEGTDYKYNGQDHFIAFANGSRIDLLDLRYLPSDPLYERYGSVEYTGGWIEEGGEINFGAYDTLKTRVGRHMNDECKLLRKIFITCNPKKNWMYTTFYKPSLTGELADYQQYLDCLVQENPFIEKDYVDALKSTQDKTKKERLLKGNWDYDDSPNAMCGYEAILEMFKNPLVERNFEFYLTADIARFGSDKARIAVWNSMSMCETLSFAVSKTTDIQQAIQALRIKYGIPRYHCIADEDGVGGGVVDNCEIVGFSNNAKPLNGENYKNLQTQCAYKLAEKINANEIGIEADLSEEDKEQIALELQEGLQTYKSDSDRKLEIIPKAEVKKNIGCSPDWRDLMLMRMYFEYESTEAQDLTGYF